MHLPGLSDVVPLGAVHIAHHSQKIGTKPNRNYFRGPASVYRVQNFGVLGVACWFRLVDPQVYTSIYICALRFVGLRLPSLEMSRRLSYWVPNVACLSDL